MRGKVFTRERSPVQLVILTSALAVGELLTPGGAYADDKAWDHLLDLIHTRDTQFEARGPEQPERTRSFDADGWLIREEIRHSDGTLETYSVSPDYRTRTTKLRKHDGTWREIRESWPDQNQWTLRETLDGNGTEPHSRVEEYPQDGQLVSVSFRKVAGNWKEAGRESHPLVMYRGERRSPPPPPVTYRPLPVPASASGYHACDFGGSETSPVSCPSFLIPIDLSRLDGVSAVAPMECRQGRDLVTTHHFRIDLATCGGDPATIARLQRAVTRSFDTLKCAAGYNPQLARGLVSYVVRNRPRIRCLGHLSGEAIERACSESQSVAECARSVRDEPGAFQLGASSDINLVKADPRRNGGDPADPAPDLLIHELMHAAGIPHDENLHNASSREDHLSTLPSSLRTDEVQARLNHWRQADPVYAIGLLCGGTPPGRSLGPPLDRFERGWLERLSENPDTLPRMVTEGGRRRLVQHRTPGGVLEMACTAFVSYRQPQPGAPASRYSVFDQGSIAPECRDLNDRVKAQIDRFDEGVRRREEERNAEHLQMLESLGLGVGEN